MARKKISYGVMGRRRDHEWIIEKPQGSHGQQSSKTGGNKRHRISSTDEREKVNTWPICEEATRCMFLHASLKRAAQKWIYCYI